MTILEEPQSPNFEIPNSEIPNFGIKACWEIIKITYWDCINSERRIVPNTTIDCFEGSGVNQTSNRCLLRYFNCCDCMKTSLSFIYWTLKTSLLFAFAILLFIFICYVFIGFLYML